MASEREQNLYKAIAKVLNYKKVNMTELTTKRGSEMLYKDLIRLGFQVLAPAEPEWSFIKIFQVMFQDQNHMPDKVKVDPQLVLDILVFCYGERVMVVHENNNYCELAVIKGGEGVIYGQECKRPKTLKIALFKIFSPAIYNDSTPDELADLILNKAFVKINYTFEPMQDIPTHVIGVLKELKSHLPLLETPMDLMEVVDGFLRLLGKRGIQIVSKNK